jgi:GTPase-activating protein BEM2
MEVGLTGNVLLQIPAEAVAEQLFLFHLKYLTAVDPAQDMSLLLDRSASQRFRSPLVFSQQSPHFLTRLVYTHILGLDAPEAGLDVSLRASFMTRWAEIGQSMKARGDLAGFLAIATALLSIPILRLKETWTDVDVELRGLIIRDWSPMMKELHRRELGVQGATWAAHVLTPDLKREDLDSHLVIPYYGDICTALESFEIWAVLFLTIRQLTAGHA